MGKVAEKLKQKLTGAKNKVKGAADKTTSKAKQGVSSPDASTGKARTNQQSRRFEEGGPGTEIGRKDAAEKARRSGMTKGTAGAADTGSDYEQGAAGSNK